MSTNVKHPQMVAGGELVTFAHWTALHGQPGRPRSAPDGGARMLGAALDRERERQQVFVSTLAHELREPLSTLSAAIEVVRLTPDQVATARAIEIMQRQVRQLNRVVEDCLDETRWARGK